MNIVIIGANGMLGSALAATFTDENPTLWDKNDLDITNADEVMAKLGALQPTVIINAAAYTDVDGAETQREQAFAVNETGVRNIAQAAKQLGATLVHYSTDFVFPGDNPDGYRESDPPGPAINAYGESKLAGERVLRDIGPTYYLVRTSWLYGPGGKNFVDTMVTLGETKTELAVVNDQHGSPTFTYDVAKATQQLLATKPPGIYHTVNSGATTKHGFAQEIFKRVGKQITLQPVTTAEFPRPAKRPQYSMLINSQGPDLRSWQDALDDYLKNYQSNPS